MKLGYTAYGVYWALIEDLYNNDNKLLYDLELLAFDFRVDEEIIEAIINNFDLFTVVDGFLSSESIQRRLDIREEKSARARKSVAKRWAKNNDSNTTVIQKDTTVKNSNTLKERKVKESKVKEIKESKLYKNNHTHLSLSDEQYEKFTKTYGEEVTDDYISRILNYTGNKRYNNLELTLMQWLKKDGVNAKPSNNCFKWRYEGKIHTLPEYDVEKFEKEKKLLGSAMKVIKTPEDYGV